MKEVINRFVEDRNLALIGVSKDPNKFGNILLKELTKRGYRIFPVHPELEETAGTKCYRTTRDLPIEVENLLLVVQPKVSEAIISELNPAQIKRVWMHRGMGKGSASEEAIQQCRQKGIEVVYGFCPMMFLAHTGFHRFHLWMRQNLGKTPEEYKNNG